MAGARRASRAGRVRGPAQAQRVRRAHAASGRPGDALSALPERGEAARKPASRRILLAARALVGRGGAAQVSMGDVAAEAGVSKALVHYHFHDKDSLLLALVEEVGGDVVRRKRELLARQDSTQALDDAWRSLADELAHGDLRILLSLAEYDSERVRDASRRVVADRRALARSHAAAIYERLGLVPRVPAELIAETLIAFEDGLAAAHALEPARDPRPAFDVLWLGLLTLGD